MSSAQDDQREIPTQHTCLHAFWEGHSRAVNTGTTIKLSSSGCSDTERVVSKVVVDKFAKPTRHVG